jgi:hypothetical protein
MKYWDQSFMKPANKAVAAHRRKFICAPGLGRS